MMRLVGERVHPTDEQVVVAGREGLDDRALERRDRAVEQRQARLARLPRRAAEVLPAGLDRVRPAKQSESACWSSDRMLTAYRPAARTIGVRNRRRSSATITSGGSSETELSALTVIPNGRSPSSAVTTVTPVDEVSEHPPEGVGADRGTCRGTHRRSLGPAPREGARPTIGA